MACTTTEVPENGELSRKSPVCCVSIIHLTIQQGAESYTAHLGTEDYGRMTQAASVDVTPGVDTPSP